MNALVEVVLKAMRRYLKKLRGQEHAAPVSFAGWEYLPSLLDADGHVVGWTLCRRSGQGRRYDFRRIPKIDLAKVARHQEFPN